MKHPSVIQLSRLKAPELRRGRPYTVDFGIAKPLYKQLLSNLGSPFHSFKPPTNDLFSVLGALRIRGRFLLFVPILISVYLALIMPLTSPQRIVYADPIRPLEAVLPAPQLTMPVLAVVEPLQSILSKLMPFGTYANSFAPGNCTWGVASRLPVTWSGNANQWAVNAAAQGYQISDTPKVGAIAATSGDSYLGHVGIVTAIADGSFTVWEENYYGYGVTDERVTSTSEFGSFIYL